MTRITAWRRHPLARYAVLILALALVGMVYAAFVAGRASPRTRRSRPARRTTWRRARVFSTRTAPAATASTPRARRAGPTLIGVGAAVRRLPDEHRPHAGRSAGRAGAAQAAAPSGSTRRPSRTSRPTSSRSAAARRCPATSRSTPSSATPARAASCSAPTASSATTSAGAGGALTQGKYAPDLNNATPTQIYEAMVTGPQAMPVFNDSTITPEEKRDMIAYITQVREQKPNPGGFGLGPHRPGHRGSGRVDRGHLRPRARRHLDHREEATEVMTDNEHEIEQPDDRVPRRVIGTPGPGTSMLGEVETKTEARPPQDDTTPGVILQDEQKARSAEKIVALCFTITFLAAVAFIISYVVFQVGKPGGDGRVQPGARQHPDAGGAGAGRRHRHLGPPDHAEVRAGPGAPRDGLRRGRPRRGRPRRSCRAPTRAASSSASCCAARCCSPPRRSAWSRWCCCATSTTAR